MICCENNFCLYWQDDTCLLENISLSLQGVCQKLRLRGHRRQPVGCFAAKAAGALRKAAYRTIKPITVRFESARQLPVFGAQPAGGIRP